jgi:hypothetical protein
LLPAPAYGIGLASTTAPLPKVHRAATAPSGLIGLFDRIEHAFVFFNESLL